LYQTLTKRYKHYEELRFSILFELVCFCSKGKQSSRKHVGPASEMALEVGSDALPELVAYAEEGISVGLAKADVEQTSSVYGEEEGGCDVYVFVYEYYSFEECEDGSFYEEWGYGMGIAIICE